MLEANSIESMRRQYPTMNICKNCGRLIKNHTVAEYSSCKYEKRTYKKNKKIIGYIDGFKLVYVKKKMTKNQTLHYKMSL